MTTPSGDGKVRIDWFTPQTIGVMVSTAAIFLTGIFWLWSTVQGKERELWSLAARISVIEGKLDTHEKSDEKDAVTYNASFDRFHSRIKSMEDGHADIEARIRSVEGQINFIRQQYSDFLRKKLGEEENP